MSTVTLKIPDEDAAMAASLLHWMADKLDEAIVEPEPTEVERLQLELPL